LAYSVSEDNRKESKSLLRRHEGNFSMGMKLVMAIVQNDDADDLIDALTAADFRATRLASTGGFLRQGNTTVIVGVPVEAVNDVLNIVASHGHNPKQALPNSFPTFTANLPKAQATEAQGSGVEVQAGRATVFVLDLERYERI